MKKETITMIENEVNESLNKLKNAGYDVEIVYLPCIVTRGSKGEVGSIQYPNTSSIFKSENNDINL